MASFNLQSARIDSAAKLQAAARAESRLRILLDVLSPDDIDAAELQADIAALSAIVDDYARETEALQSAPLC